MFRKFEKRSFNAVRFNLKLMAKMCLFIYQFDRVYTQQMWSHVLLHADTHSYKNYLTFQILFLNTLTYFCNRFEKCRDVLNDTPPTRNKL